MKRSFVRAPQLSNKNGQGAQGPAPASPPTTNALLLLLRGLRRSRPVPAAAQG